MSIKKYKNQTNKNILILGYGKTGRSIAFFLKNKKFNIYFWDDNKEILNKINSRFLKYTKQNLGYFHSIFASPGISKNHKIIKNAIKNKIKISSDIELFLNELENKNNILLAVTGTNGKSTIALMISKVLKVKPLANYGNTALENLQKINKNIVLELSSFQLDYLNFIKPKVSIISNIKEDHTMATSKIIKNQK
jgi:UDP-N-acetylmuramoylalanine--D-glutamate ligase